MEVWKDIKKYEGLYQVSSLGRVMRLEQEYPKKEAKILKLFVCGKKNKTTLCQNAKGKQFYVDELVAEAFVPNPKGYSCVLHLNGNEKDDNASNLTWVETKSNTNIDDFLGKRFGLLRIIDYSISKSNIRFDCKCDCGNVVRLTPQQIATGHNISCGCKLGKDYGINKRTKHGLYNHRLYKTWNNITQRCGKHKSYKNISVCDKWANDFISFYNWSIENGYREGLSIDRINVNGNYEPSNCRWITQKEQNRNKRNNHYVTINGETKCLADWFIIYNNNSGRFWKRIKRGWSEEDAITTPIVSNKKSLNK